MTLTGDFLLEINNECNAYVCCLPSYFPVEESEATSKLLGFSNTADMSRFSCLTLSNTTPLVVFILASIVIEKEFLSLFVYRRIATICVHLINPVTEVLILKFLIFKLFNQCYALE